MYLKSIEICDTYDYTTDISEYGFRTIIYETQETEMFLAIEDFINNFDENKMVVNEDSFNGECQSSHVISYELIKNY